MGQSAVFNLLGYLAIAFISMTVICYSLAIPRLRPALERSKKVSVDRRKDIETKMKEGNKITLKEIEKELEDIKKEEGKWISLIDSLSWKQVIIYPNICFTISIIFTSICMVVSSTDLFYIIFMIVIVGSLGAGVFLLFRYIMKIEDAAARVG